MKQKILYILQQLIGYDFVQTTRTANIECLQFGVMYRIDRKGKKRQVGEFGLHLQCPWRLSKGRDILIGSEDLFEQPNELDEYDENFNWDIQGGNLRDKKWKSFFNSGRKYIVELVNADELGGFELIFNDDIRLTVFPALSSKSEYSEFWRFLDNKNLDRSHFVVGGQGIID